MILSFPPNFMILKKEGRDLIQRYMPSNYVGIRQPVGVSLHNLRAHIADEIDVNSAKEQFVESGG